jgi:hypothetical protein
VCFHEIHIFHPYNTETRGQNQFPVTDTRLTLDIGGAALMRRVPDDGRIDGSLHVFVRCFRESAVFVLC